MASYFVESSDMGKLYLNYPMVEAFYHMETIPDEGFYFRYATLDELLTGQYKQRVNRENRNHDYRKFAVTKEECDIVIKQHMNKAWRLVGKQDDQQYPPTQIDVLSEELKIISSENQVAVLNTCVFFIPEYNPDLIRM
jgi:hypothetical protein